MDISFKEFGAHQLYKGARRARVQIVKWDNFALTLVGRTLRTVDTSAYIDWQRGNYLHRRSRTHIDRGNDALRNICNANLGVYMFVWWVPISGQTNCREIDRDFHPTYK